MSAAAIHSADLAALRRRSTEGTLELRYEPVVDLALGGIVAMAAQLRWQRRVGVAVPGVVGEGRGPEGRRQPVAHWMLREGAREAALWQRIPGPVRPLWLNVSSAQVRRAGFVDLVGSIIEEHRLAPGALGLEINETTLRALGRNAGPVLTDLRLSGAGLAIDNLGGWSAVLQGIDLLPVSALKLGLDQVQSSDLPRLERAAASVVREAVERDLDVVAEGVDTVDVAERLTDLGCDSAHGWLYASAQRGDKARWLLTQGPGWRGAPITPGTRALPGPRSPSLSS